MTDDVDVDADDDHRLEEVLAGHREAVATGDGFEFTATALLEALAAWRVPPEDRPHYEPLAAFSTPARRVSLDRLNREAPGDDREVIITATPEELLAFTDQQVARAISRRVMHGELQVVEGGDDPETDEEVDE